MIEALLAPLLVVHARDGGVTAIEAIYRRWRSISAGNWAAAWSYGLEMPGCLSMDLSPDFV